MTAHIDKDLIVNNDDLRFLLNCSEQWGTKEFNCDVWEERPPVKRALHWIWMHCGRATKLQWFAPLVRHKNCTTIGFIEFRVPDECQPCLSVYRFVSVLHVLL